MSSASEIAPTAATREVLAPPKPFPLASLTASARRITADDVRRSGPGYSAQGWQEDAWDMFDLVGEQHFLATTLAGRMAQARLYVGTMPEEPTDAPDPVTDDDDMQDMLDEIGSGELGLAQIIARLGINLFITGDGWIGGVPSGYVPPSYRVNEVAQDWDPAADVRMSDLEWRTFSISEVSTRADGTVTLRYGPNAEDVAVVPDPEKIYLIRVWRPHPRRSWEADSPTRSSLSVLREITGLTMHVGAQVDSRLAGAGLLLVPQSAADAIKRSAGLGPEDASDPFTDALIEAMLTPINDRASASALVPLVVTVPDESITHFKHLSFATALDETASDLRSEAIRRLALGEDAPPELLLGTGGMNHWGAWLVREDVVTTHLEPPLALICDALTTQYLWPMLRQTRGWEQAKVEQYVVWYDVSHMIVRPNRAADAQNLHAAGVLSDQALREANGFDEADAPYAVDADSGEKETKIDQAGLRALDIIAADPTLIRDPGLEEIVRQVRAAMEGSLVPSAAPTQPAPETTTAESEVPDTADDQPTPPPPPAVTAGGSPVSEVDALDFLEDLPPLPLPQVTASRGVGR